MDSLHVVSKKITSGYRLLASFFWILSLLVVLTQCKQEDPEPTQDPEPEPPAPKIYPAALFSVKNVGSTALTAKIEVIKRGDQTIKSVDVEYSTDNKFVTPQIVTLGTAIVTNTDVFQKRITQLTSNATYFVRSAIRVADTVIYSAASEVKTFPPLTFYKYEPNTSSNTPVSNHPKMSFTKGGKGYTFTRNPDFTVSSLTEFDSEKEAWKHTAFTNAIFLQGLFTKSDMTSFTMGNRYFVGFGYGGSPSGMSRTMFEFNLETGLCTELPPFTGGTVQRVETITHNDQAYAFTLESVSVDGQSRDSLVVHEFDLPSLQWKRRAAVWVIRPDLLFSFEREGKLYVISNTYGSSEIKTLFEYDINNRLLEIIDGNSGPTLIREQLVRANYRYNNKIYYISVDTENQYLNMFDPLTLTDTRLVVYPKETIRDDVASSFLIGNTLYTQSHTLKFYAIDL